MDFKEPIIDLKPKNQYVPLVYLDDEEKAQDTFMSTIDIKMKFTEKRFTMMYVSLKDCLSPLGGIQ